MYQPIVLYIGLRYISRKKTDRFGRFIFWLSTIAIMVSVTAMITVLSVMNGFERELKNSILKLIPQAILTTSEGLLDPKCVPAVMLNSLSGVTRITPLITSDVVLHSNRNMALGVMLGIKPEDPEPLSNYFVEGNQKDLVAGQYRVILGHRLATILGVKRGDTVRLVTLSGISQFTPIGHIPSQRLFTVTGTFNVNSEVDSYQLLVNQKDASRLMRYPLGYISGWRLWLNEPLMVENISTQSLPKGLIWHDWRERKGELFQAIRMEKNMMNLLLSLIVAVAAFNVLTSLGLLTMEKKAEIAILQTQGLTRRQVVLIFMIQGGTASVIGALLGSIFGILLATQINHLLPLIGGIFTDEIKLPVLIEPIQIINISIYISIVALLSTIYPSLYAASVRPVEILRYE